MRFSESWGIILAQFVVYVFTVKLKQLKLILTFFKCMAKLIGETNAQLAQTDYNPIMKTAAFDTPLKYQIICLRSLKMPLINFKVELKVKWT